MTTWKPGDLAMVKCSDGEWRQATCEPHASHVGVLVWRFPDRVYRDIDNSTARPIVAVDPDDRHQVERLIDAVDRQARLRGYAASSDRRSTRIDAMTDALHTLIALPKPAEPTGLGAVVEDADGEKWVRLESAPHWTCDGVGSGHYAGINAVRVLSDGVQP